MAVNSALVTDAVQEVTPSSERNCDKGVLPIVAYCVVM